MDNFKDKPYLLFKDNLAELEVYGNTEYGKILNTELNELVHLEKITSFQKDLVLGIKAHEYYTYCTKGNAWYSIKYYLENFPELFTVHDLLLIEEPVEKYFIIINSATEIKFEEILKFEELNHKKHQRELPDGRLITIYIVYLEFPEKYSLKLNPVRRVWTTAEDSGIRVGFHNYPTKENMNRYYNIGLYRSFPIQSDDFGDYSRASGGLRKDLGTGFKSSWEANIARLLKEKNLEWEYENSFVSTEIGSYIPDFRVKKDGKTYIIEVKGFWDNKSVKKVSTMLRQPMIEEKVIIDSDFYSILDMNFKEKINNWEPSQVQSEVFKLPVIGLSFGSRMKFINELTEGDHLRLIPEPNNPYDPFAIQVATDDNNQVGYIAKDWASIFSYKMKCGFKYDAHLLKKDFEKKHLLISLKPQIPEENLIEKIPFLFNN